MIERWYNIVREKLFVKDLPDSVLTKEQEMGLFAELWQNPTFRKYLTAREQYLKDILAERFLNGNTPKAEGFAGQMLEIRTLRNRTRGAYLVISKQKSLTKAQEK